MSNEAITWAYGQDLNKGAKFVLVALADLADEAHSCYPGQAKLAAMTGQSTRTVRRQLVLLTDAGFVMRARRFDGLGHRTSDRYVLPVGQQIIPSGQSDQRTTGPVVNETSGQNDLRSTGPSLPDNLTVPTGQSDQVSLREPSEEPSDKPSSSDVAPQRQDAERLCQLLADLIEANGAKRPRITQPWRDAARRLLDIDGKSEQQVEAAIRWCQADEFWRANVLSMPKLREQYERLRLQAQRPRGRPDLRIATADQRFADGMAVAAELREAGL